MVSNGSAASFEAVEYGYLHGMGLSDKAAAAFLGNFQVESGFSPTAYNGAEGAVGIAQWEGGRRTSGLDVFAGAHGLAETDIAAQLGYLKQELTGPYARALTDAERSPDVTTAAAAVDAEFEGSAGTTRGARMSDAQSILAQIQAGSLTGGAIPASSGGANSIGLTSGNPLGGVTSALGGLNDLLPWNVTKDVRSIVTTIIAFVLKMGFVVGGITLVVLGALRASAPARESASQQLAPLAAAAA